MLRSPLDRARSVLACRSKVSVAGHCGPAGWVFSTRGFHCFFATKPIGSETSKAERGRSVVNHGSIWDSWPIAFSGCPRGPRVGYETGCPRHAAPNYSAETRSRTRVSQESNQPPPEKVPGDGAESVRDAQAVCDFRCWASKETPFFHTINTIAAIFLARVRRAISGLIPLATKAA